MKINNHEKTFIDENLLRGPGGIRFSDFR